MRLKESDLLETVPSIELHAVRDDHSEESDRVFVMHRKLMGAPILPGDSALR
jgi:hypothetical protein